MTRTHLHSFIAAEKTIYPVRLLCRALHVSPSAFYDSIRRGSPSIIQTDLDANQLREAWAEHRRVYGARRLTAEIHDRGRRWNRKKVARLMPTAGIEGAHRRRKGEKRSRLDAVDPSGSGQTPVHSGGTGPDMGCRHLLPADLGRLPLPGRRRCLQPPGGGLGDDRSSPPRTRPRRGRHGATAARSGNGLVHHSDHGVPSIRRSTLAGLCGSPERWCRWAASGTRSTM
jgi:hypothetical protein